MSRADGFGDVRAELVDVAEGKPHTFVPVAAGAPAGHVPPAAGAPNGEDSRATGALAGPGPAAGAPADLVPVGRGAPAGVLPAGGGSPRGLAAAPGRPADEDLPAAGGAGIDHTEILIRPAVSVVVCAFTEDRWEDICRVLGSLRAQTEAPGEIILVIDHCPALLRRARLAFPEVTIVPNHFQKGLAGGRNTGVAHAWGDVVAFIDDDAFADPIGSAVSPTTTWIPPWRVSAAWWSPPGSTGGLGGSRPSLTGWWAAATWACARAWGRSGTSSAPICHSAGRFSRRLAGSPSSWAGSIRTRSAARKPNCACGSASAIRTPFFCTNRPRRSTTGSVSSVPGGAICGRAVMPRAGQRPRWRAWPGPNRRWRPSVPTSGPRSPGGSAGRCGRPYGAGRPGCCPPSPL